MNAMLSQEQIAEIKAQSDTIFADLMQQEKVKRHSGPWNDSEKGRIRRNTRRNVRNAKQAFAFMASV